MEKRILLYPKEEKLLRKVSVPITNVDRKVRKLIRDLKDTLAQQPGVGLSAPQIGIHSRVAIIKLGQTHDGDEEEMSAPIPLINPRILSTEGEVKDYDACLSIPGLYGFTYRPQRITLSTLTEDGTEKIMELADLDARVAVHEMDHLDGILFLDRIRSQEDLYIVRKDRKGENIWIRMSDLERSLVHPLTKITDL